MSPFDFLNSINDTKVNLIKEDPLCEKDYSAFMVNRGLSYFYDTVMLANEMNMHHQLDKKMQYDFYLAGVRKKKRFSKWSKVEKHDDVELICREYGYSKERAVEALELLSKEQIGVIKEKYTVGGR